MVPLGFCIASRPVPAGVVRPKMWGQEMDLKSRGGSAVTNGPLRLGGPSRTTTLGALSWSRMQRFLKIINTDGRSG